MSSPPSPDGAGHGPGPTHPPPPADLQENLPVMIVWAFFNLGAVCANALLFLLSLRSARLRGNPVLLNLEVIFMLTCASGAMLFWTGYPMSQQPPEGLCLFNAAIVLANPLATSGAALGLVLKVWANAMAVYYPSSKILDMIGSTVFLVALPHVSSMAFFIATLAKSLRHRELVNRASPFYCTLDDPLGFTASLIVAVFTFIALVGAAWTAAYVARSHYRVRSIRSGRHTNYQLIVRTLLFSGFVAVAFVCGIVSLFSSFSAVVQDMVVSTLGLAAFAIFASDRDILRMVVPCFFRPATPSGTLSGFSFKRPAASNQPGAGGAELVTLSGSTMAGHSTPALGTVGGDGKQARVLELNLPEVGEANGERGKGWGEDSDDEVDRKVQRATAV